MKTSIELGYYPRPIECQTGDVRVTTLPGLEETVGDVAGSEDVENG